MRILYLSQLIPYPADAGPKVRIYHVIQHLASCGHEITFVAFRREGDRSDQIDRLRRYCSQVHTVPMRRSRVADVWHFLRSLAVNEPFLIARDKIREMSQTVRALVATHAWDAIHADQLWMAQHALAVAEHYRSDSRPRLVLDQHNAVYLIPTRLAASVSNPIKRAFLALEGGRMARYELEACKRFDWIVWVTDEDRRAVAKIANGEKSLPKSVTIPICVDPREKLPVDRGKSPRRVTFLGGLHWPPNLEGVLWFKREVWPLIQERVPDSLLTILGKNPPPSLQHGAETNSRLEAPGYIPDPIPYLRETAAFIVPLMAGGGMRVKIIDAWSWGLPVVSTSLGAEGIRFTDGENLLIADNPDEFARAVVNLIRRPELAERVGTAGRQTVETCYDWRSEYQAWNEIYG